MTAKEWGKIEDLLNVRKDMTTSDREILKALRLCKDDELTMDEEEILEMLHDKYRDEIRSAQVRKLLKLP